MAERDTPYKRAVHMIIHSIVNGEPEYVYKERYMRWGKVERELWELEDHHLTISSSGRATTCDCPKVTPHCPYLLGQNCVGKKPPAA